MAFVSTANISESTPLNEFGGEVTILINEAEDYINGEIVSLINVNITDTITRINENIDDILLITSITATATTLPSGQPATASYSNGVISLGLPKGKDGATWYSDIGLPNDANGVNDDFYLREDTQAIYKKVNGVWVDTGIVLVGSQGEQGQGIDHVSRTLGDGSQGTTDTYTVWGDAAETINLGTFDVYNGVDGLNGADGNDGVGISSILLTNTVDNVDTYTITYTDSTETTFNVTNGTDGVDGTNGIDGIDGYSITDVTSNKVGNTTTVTITGTFPTSPYQFEIEDGLDGAGSGDLISTNNLSDLSDIPTARTNLGVYSATEVDNAIANIDALPDQTGNSGKYLTTDGTEASWGDVATTLDALTDTNTDDKTGKDGYVLTWDEVSSKYILTEATQQIPTTPTPTFTIPTSIYEGVTTTVAITNYDALNTYVITDEVNCTAEVVGSNIEVTASVDVATASFNIYATQSGYADSAVAPFSTTIDDIVVDAILESTATADTIDTTYTTKNNITIVDGKAQVDEGTITIDGTSTATSLVTYDPIYAGDNLIVDDIDVDGVSVVEEVESVLMYAGATTNTAIPDAEVYDVCGSGDFSFVYKFTLDSAPDYSELMGNGSNYNLGLRQYNSFGGFYGFRLYADGTTYTTVTSHTPTVGVNYTAHIYRISGVLYLKIHDGSSWSSAVSIATTLDFSTKTGLYINGNNTADSMSGSVQGIYATSVVMTDEEALSPSITKYTVDITSAGLASAPTTAINKTARLTTDVLTQPTFGDATTDDFVVTQGSYINQEMVDIATGTNNTTQISTNVDVSGEKIVIVDDTGTAHEHTVGTMTGSNPYIESGLSLAYTPAMIYKYPTTAISNSFGTDSATGAIESVEYVSGNTLKLNIADTQPTAGTTLQQTVTSSDTDCKITDIYTEVMKEEVV